MTRRYLRWPPVLQHGVTIVGSYDTGVTLRQLFYRLVADETLPNTRSYYQTLSSYTAKGRREGTFPDLLDRTSRIERPSSYDGVDEVMDFVIDYLYRRDRTEGQDWTIYLGVEKAGLSAQLHSWFDDLGLPIVALGGYASQTLCDAVRRDIEKQARPAALAYAGDLDPTGIDIDRDFVARVGVFDKVIRVALTPEQVEQYRLPFSFDPEVMEKLEKDPRAAAFKRLYGGLQQYEVDALPPEVLRDLYRSAISEFWDEDAYNEVIAQEDDDVEQLRQMREQAS